MNFGRYDAKRYEFVNSVYKYFSFFLNISKQDQNFRVSIFIDVEVESVKTIGGNII